MKFADAIKANIKNLRSDEFKNREDAEDTLPEIETFVKINRLGFLTTGSQQGRNYKGYNDESKRFYEIHERAFIDGFMERKKALKFIDYLNTYSDKIAFFIHIEDSESFKKLFFEGETKRVPSIPVTVSASGKTKLSVESFHTATHIPTILPEKSFDFEKKNAHLNKSEDVLYVVVIDPVYGRKAPTNRGLFNDVFEALGAKSTQV